MEGKGSFDVTWSAYFRKKTIYFWNERCLSISRIKYSILLLYSTRMRKNASGNFQIFFFVRLFFFSSFTSEKKRNHNELVWSRCDGHRWSCLSILQYFVCVCVYFRALNTSELREMRKCQQFYIQFILLGLRFGLRGNFLCRNRIETKISLNVAV